MVFATFDLTPQQPGSFQHHHMFRNRIQRNGEGLGDLIDGGWASLESPQDRAPCGICQGGEDAIQICGNQTLNHAVECYARYPELSKEILCQKQIPWDQVADRVTGSNSRSMRVRARWPRVPAEFPYATTRPLLPQSAGGKETPRIFYGWLEKCQIPGHSGQTERYPRMGKRCICPAISSVQQFPRNFLVPNFLVICPNAQPECHLVFGRA